MRRRDRNGPQVAAEAEVADRRDLGPILVPHHVGRGAGAELPARHRASAHAPEIKVGLRGDASLRDLFVPTTDPWYADETRIQDLWFFNERVREIALAPRQLEPGQALIWAANLFHGGSPIVDTTRTRLSQVTHYYFEGCFFRSQIVSIRSWIGKK